MISTDGYPKAYQVICVRDGGERLVVSTHVSQMAAEIAVNLMRKCAGSGDIRIESPGRRGRRRTQRLQ